MKGIVGYFIRQLLQATEIIASDWLRADLSDEISDKSFHETLPGHGPRPRQGPRGDWTAVEKWRSVIGLL